MNNASAGDEVRLTADEYYLDTQLVISQPNLTISGPPGRYAPSDFRSFIFFRTQAEGAPAGFDNTAKIRTTQDGLTLARISLVGQAGTVSLIDSLLANDMRLDRVTITDNGSAASVTGQDAIITGTIRASTITSSTGVAVINDDAHHLPGSPFFDYCELEVVNTIAVGAVDNMAAADGTSACDPVIRVNYSWVPTAGTGGGLSDPGNVITRGANNLANTPAAIADPLSGGTSLALDSPAINAGCGGSCGNEDLYGRPRPIGAGNDIGATETILPPAVSGVGVIVTGPTPASLSATVNPNGAVTTCDFQVRAAGTARWTSFSSARTGDGVTDVPARRARPHGHPAACPCADPAHHLHAHGRVGDRRGPQDHRAAQPVTPGV